MERTTNEKIHERGMMMETKRTNADVIRAMSDEELAKLLCNVSDCLGCPVIKDCYEHVNGYIAWLKKESEE